MTEYLCIILLVFSSVLCVVEGQTSDNVGNFINNTFCFSSTSSCSSTYKKEIFPRVNQWDRVAVDMTFGLVAISNFDEVAGHLQLVGNLDIKWTDTIVLAAYSSASYTLTDIMVPQTEVWLPTVTVFNSVDEMKSVGDSSYYVRITVMDKTNAIAHMQWKPGIVTKTGCSVDVYKYPWDTQVCEVIFTPWGYNSSEVEFELNSKEISLTQYQGNEQWEIQSSSVATATIQSASYAKFTLVLKRKPTFFLLTMFLPIEILGILNILVFILPPDSGERVGYSVTAFLTFAVYLTIVSDNLPKASNPMPLFAFFMISMLLLSAFICFVTIMTLRAYIRADEEKVPKSLARFIELLYCRPCCKKKKKKEPEQRKPDPYDEYEMNGFAKPIQAKPEKEEEDEFEVDWIMVGKTMDTFFLFLFTITIGLMTVSFLGPLALS